MSENQHLDTLPSFHLHAPNDEVYALVAHLISVLENNNINMEEIERNISNILDEAAATSILKLICRKNHVDYLQLMQDCQKFTSHHISPKLLLHIACLPLPYVSAKLQIDEYRANQLLDELRKNFIIDDPILWLKFLLTTIEKEQIHNQLEKEDLLHGLAVVNQPVDTAEERKLKERRLRLHLKPSSEP